MNHINISEKFSMFDTFWDPKIVAELNGQHVKLVKLQGEFIWHSHEHEDELFFVINGKLKIEFRHPADSCTLGPGEMIVVPRGVEHTPVALSEAHVLLFEPASTINTGGIRDERTKESLEKL